MTTSTDWPQVGLHRGGKLTEADFAHLAQHKPLPAGCDQQGRCETRRWHDTWPTEPGRLDGAHAASEYQGDEPARLPMSPGIAVVTVAIFILSALFVAQVGYALWLRWPALREFLAALAA